MNRDSTTISPWQENIPGFSPDSFAKEDFIYDVIIVGGGITGLTSALLLQKAGKKCLLIEAKNIGFGTTTGTTAHLNTMMDTSYDQIISDFGEESARMVHKITNQAIQLIETHVKEYNIECDFQYKKGYLYAEDDDQAKELDKIYEGSRKVGVDIGYSNEIPLPVPFTKAISFGEQAQFQPAKYIIGIANEFEKLGGIILHNCRVLNRIDGDEVTVETQKGNYKCIDLVYATHLPPGVNLLHFENTPYRSYVITAKLKDGNYPDALVYDMQDPYHYYRTYTEGNEKFLILGGEDHKTGHEENTEKIFRNLEAYLQKYYQVESIVHRWSSQYYEPADGLPYIGHTPGLTNHVYVATGFSGNGMTWGTASSLILFDLLTKGKSEYEPLFKPSRINVKASISEVVKENIDVVGHFVGDWLSVKKIPTLLDIATNDAKVVKYEGKIAAIYKDSQSQIHAVNPACTHLKCSVLWNSSEKSWDCPCHGSRFSFDGEVLVGPARKDLEAINLGVQ